MKEVLITGASGFLGSAVVPACLDHGFGVRALVRPAAGLAEAPWRERVRIFKADLRAPGDLSAALDGVFAVVHLAAGVLGDADSQFASTAVASERLFEAMRDSGVRRLVLASSLAVYDFEQVKGALDEGAPLLGRKVYRRGGYAIAKLWQERLARRYAADLAWDLTVLRPGFIWGRGRLEIPGWGWRLGGWRVALGVRRRLPLTYVENCADCLVRALEDPAASGETFNVVDSDAVTAARHIREVAGRLGRGGRQVSIPYLALAAPALVADGVARRIFGERRRLPMYLTPCQLAVFRPLRYSNDKLRTLLGWQPPYDYDMALERALAPSPALPRSVAVREG